MANTIVQVNVSLQVAPTPPTLQQTGAIVSVGGTLTSPGTASVITQPSDLTPLLTSPAVVSSVAWNTGVVTVTTGSPHNLPVGEVMMLSLAGFVPTGFNGNWSCTITGASSFTFVLPQNPGSVTTEGTWQAYAAVELSQAITTYFAQGYSNSVYVLELGASDVTHAIANLTAYLTANPNIDYTPGATGYFYAYLVPREWDANSAFLTLIQGYESPTSRTYFIVTTTLSTYASYTDLMKDVISVVESPAIGTWTANSLTGLSYSNGQATATTSSAHGVLVGEWFQIAGCTPNGYNGWWQAAPGTTGSTLVWNVPSNPGAESVLGTLLASSYPNTGVTSGEFSAAAFLYKAIGYAPSSANLVTPYQFSFLYGVTPFPLRGYNALWTTLKASFTNWVGTGAEGGISQAIILWGTTQDGQTFNYWYSIDWVQINLDVNTANAVINGSNNPLNPLYYNQQGIDRLQGVGAATLSTGIIYGLVNGNVTQTSLDGPVFEQNLDAGLYTDQTVINAVPFVTYSLENPGDYKIGRYAGFGVVYMPQVGFSQIVYNVVVTELVAQ